MQRTLHIINHPGQRGEVHWSETFTVSRVTYVVKNVGSSKNVDFCVYREVHYIPYIESLL